MKGRVGVHAAKPTLLALVILICIGTTSASAKSARTNIERTFGTKGWASLSPPRGSSFASYATECTATSDRYYVASATRDSRTKKANGGVIRTLDWRGKRVAKFGGDGEIRLDRSWRSVGMRRLDSGSMLVVGEVQRGSKRVWRVRKVFKNGKFQRSFGTRGSIAVEKISGSLAPPVVERVSRNRFAIAQGSRVSLFGSSGNLIRAFGNAGHLDLSFVIDSIAEARGRILLGGSTVGVHIVKARLDGSIDLAWGAGGLATQSQMPASVIDAVGRIPWNQTGPFVESVGVADAGNGSVLFAATVWSYQSDGGWAMRLSPSGNAIASWGRGGSALLGANYTSSEVGMDHESSEYSALPGGRTLRVESVDSNSEYDSVQFHQVKFTTTGPSGRSGSKGSKVFTYVGKNMIDFGVNVAGNRAMLCFEDGRKIAVARARI